jgi:hypothetical protein
MLQTEVEGIVNYFILSADDLASTLIGWLIANSTALNILDY